jgi:hypothetical protein
MRRCQARLRRRAAKRRSAQPVEAPARSQEPRTAACWSPSSSSPQRAADGAARTPALLSSRPSAESGPPRGRSACGGAEDCAAGWGARWRGTHGPSPTPPAGVLAPSAADGGRRWKARRGAREGKGQYVHVPQRNAAAAAVTAASPTPGRCRAHTTQLTNSCCACVHTRRMSESARIACARTPARSVSRRRRQCGTARLGKEEVGEAEPGGEGQPRRRRRHRARAERRCRNALLHGVPEVALVVKAAADAGARRAAAQKWVPVIHSANQVGAHLTVASWTDAGSLVSGPTIALETESR